MRRSEKELRQIAEHIAPLLPESDEDAKRVLDLAMALKLWEDGRGPFGGDGEKTTRPGQVTSGGSSFKIVDGK